MSIKSYKKNILLNKIRKKRNKIKKSIFKTYIKNIKKYIKYNKKKSIIYYKKFQSLLDKYTLKNIISKNKSNRFKSKYFKLINKLI